jgi:carnitine-CoA ligase
LVSQFAQTERNSIEHPVRERLLGRLLEDRASQYGNRQFLDFKGVQRISYQEFNEAANRFANGLLALGLGKDQKLAVMLPNCPEYLYLVFGAAKIGAVTVPINTAYKGDLLGQLLNNSDAELLVVAEQYIDTINEIAGALGGLKTLLIYSDQSVSRTDLPHHRQVLNLDVLYEASSG